MNKRLTISVLLLAAALTAYLAVDLAVSPGNDGGSKTSTVGEPLYDKPISDGQITRMSVTFADGKTMTVERLGAKSDWKQIEPFPFRVESWRVNRIAKAAAELRWFKQFKGDDAAASGIDTPRFKVTIAGKHDGEPFEYALQLGATVVAGQGIAKIAGGETVYAVSPSLHRVLDGKKREAFLGKQLTELTPTQVDKATLITGDRSFSLASDGTAWRLTDPDNGRVDTKAADALINAIGFATVDQFVADTDDDLQRYGLDEPTHALSVEGWSGDERFTRTLKIGRATDLKDEQFYAHFSEVPIVFALSTFQVDRLRKRLDDLRDKRITPTEARDVRRIELRTPADELIAAFALEAGAWTFADPAPSYGLDRDAVNALLNGVTDALADGFTDAVDFEPDAIVKLAGARSDSTETLRIARRESGTAIVHRVGEPVARIVNVKSVEPAFASAVDFRSKLVAAIAPAQIDAMVVTHAPPFAATFELKRGPSTDDQPGTFDLTGYDRPSIDRFVASLNPLRAASWRAEADESADVTIAITLTDGSTRTLLLDTRTGGATWTATGGEAATFSLAGPVVDALSAELRDRTAVAVSAAQIASISLAGTTYNRDERGMYSVGNGTRFDQQAVAAMFDTAAGLRVERWIDAATVTMDRKQPTHTLTITPRDGDVIAVALWPAAQNDLNRPVGRVGDRYFTLPAGDYAKLVGPAEVESR